MRTTSTTRTRLRVAVAATGLLGGAWGALAALGALEVVARGPLPPADGRAGQAVGLVALVLAACALAAAVVVVRSPAVAGALLFAASVAGPLAVGGAWIGPGALQLTGAVLALGATADPFTAEIARERRARTHGRPG